MKVGIDVRKMLVFGAVLIGALPMINIYHDLVKDNVFLELVPLVRILSLPAIWLLGILGLDGAPTTSAISIPFGAILVDWSIFFFVNLLFWVAGSLWSIRLMGPPRLQVTGSLQGVNKVPLPRLVASSVLQGWSFIDVQGKLYGCAILIFLIPLFNVYFEIISEAYVYHDEHFWPISRVLSLPAYWLTRSLAPELLPSFETIPSSRQFIVSWSMFLFANLYCWLWFAVAGGWVAEGRLLKSRRDSRGQG